MDPGGGLNKTADSESVLSVGKSPLALTKTSKTTVKLPKVLSSSKGVENAKKRLRAFSIQKKTPIAPFVVPKAMASGNTTVLIGKLSSVKVTPKVEDPEQKKLPKPPKPGTARKSYQDSYTDLQKRTLAEIEDMKRKMELVELGIPLGLICPTSSDKAMPTKAMPPIKSLLGRRFRVYNSLRSRGVTERRYKRNYNPSKVDEIIREAKKAKMEGREFKFDYQKLLPDYDNPFQRKREEYERERSSDRRKSETDRNSDRRKSDKYEYKRQDYRKDDIKYKERDRDKRKEKSKQSVDDYKKVDKSGDKETDVNLSDYLVCDSWSLDNDDKNSTSSPKPQERSSQSLDTKVIEQTVQLQTNIPKRKEILKSCSVDSPSKNTPVKIEKLQPVMDSFKFEIDPNDDEVLDIFDEDSNLEKYAQQSKAKKESIYDSPVKNIKDSSLNISKDTSMDGINDDTFLESVINEIKQEDLSNDSIQDKGLVEYEISPNREDESPRKSTNGSVTPDIQEQVCSQSEKSDYSEGYRSSDSFKTTETNESGYKSVESYRLSAEKELDEALEAKMSKSTVDSLETWSFVLKICQPLLFRHDKNKCYKETRTSPKIWYTENPKRCTCVKDRSVVYEELEMCKMSLVDRVYGCDQISDFPFATVRNWYQRNGLTSNEKNPVPIYSEWEIEDSQQARPGDRSATPQRDELSLDREYQRFMEAVWPDAAEAKADTSRSTTPIRQESRKKRKEDEKEIEEKKTKKIKLSSEGWSQESDVEEEPDKSKKVKIEKDKTKSRKRKHSSSTMSSSLSDSDADSKKRRLIKKKALKKTKSKSAKRRRIGRKMLKKLKEKQYKRKQNNDSDNESVKKKDKKLKKKKQQKLKKKAQKKKKAKLQSSSSSSSSSSSTSESDSESDRKSKKIKNNKDGNKKVSKKRKRSTSDSSQSEDLFDVNILNNIKTERLTDDEKAQKMMEFSPRRQKPREIINVKELQNDFVEKIHIKQEVNDPKRKEVIKCDEFDIGNELVEIAVEQQRLPPEGRSPPEPCQVVLPSTPTIPSPVPPVTPEASVVPVPPVDLVSPVDLVVPAGPVTPTAPVAPLPDDSNLSQCSSQDSVCSVKEVLTYEKDESHLRPSSQNSNYSFNDVISASQGGIYPKGMESECEDKYAYEANYEMYEQLAMAYQSDVASQRASPPSVDTNGSVSQRIETVVRARCGEIKCDWRVGDDAAAPHPTNSTRPSRWGLKPGEVNIVLTGGGSLFTSQEDSQPVYQIQSIANRTDTNTGYDEAYMDMYGASDRLQYGDCFGIDFDNAVNNINTSVNIDVTGDTSAANTAEATRTSTLDARINKALKETILGEVAKEVETEADKEIPDKGILITNITAETRGSKRVSFADGYKPGQDSDVEDPPVKRRKKSRRYGCAWPCPAAHPDHVPLWDALPPPPPPPGSPPPPAAPSVPAHLLRPPHRRTLLPVIPGPMAKFETNLPLAGFMPPDPPPGLLSLQ